ncbi:MAG: MBL fold metallo-hydrolase, partial [Acidilobaceae archaeon]
NAISVAKGPNSIVLESAKGERTFHDVKIVGREFYHDKNRGKLRGLVAAYCLEIEKIRICHLGDIGHVPQEDQLHEFKEVDLLMLPIGGVYTIDGGEAWHLVRILEPKMVMPLHYWLPGSMLPLDPLDSFLNIAKAQRLRMSSNKFELPFKEGLEKTALIIPQPLKRRLDDGN